MYIQTNKKSLTNYYANYLQYLEKPIYFSFDLTSLRSTRISFSTHSIFRKVNLEKIFHYINEEVYL